MFGPKRWLAKICCFQIFFCVFWITTWLCDAGNLRFSKYKNIKLPQRNGGGYNRTFSTALWRAIFYLPRQPPATAIRPYFLSQFAASSIAAVLFSVPTVINAGDPPHGFWRFVDRGSQIWKWKIQLPRSTRQISASSQRLVGRGSHKLKRSAAEKVRLYPPQRIQILEG